MMVPDPLRSSTNTGSGEDTSLALPSDSSLSTGKQRVLNQVHSIKRNKTKKIKNDSLSPTSPTPSALSSHNEFGTFKYMPITGNSSFGRSSFTMSTAFNRATNTQKLRSQSTKSGRGKSFNSLSTWEQQMTQKPNGLKPSRSDSALTPVVEPSMSVKGQNSVRVKKQSTSSFVNGTITSSQTQITRPPSNKSLNEGKMGSIKEQTSTTNCGWNMMTLKEAVAVISASDESQYLSGASFIQHTTFHDETAKEEVFTLGGIPPLVKLLRSSNPSVNQAAAGALRNLVFKNKENKTEVQQHEGIAKALQLLQETSSTETQKQVTGLLWNLSSSDELKKELIKTALPVLTKKVVVPFTKGSEEELINFIDPNVFYCATGCLRNLSSGSKEDRQNMRKCPGLIESLMSYIQSCIAEETPDDKSVENSVCILQNLTYQLEKECPECFSDHNPSREDDVESKKSPTIGCFSPRSSKVQKEFSYDKPQASKNSSSKAQPKAEEDCILSEMKLLCQSKTIDTYMTLLDSSKNPKTQEACCGALQNLTAGKGLGSSAMSQMLCEKVNHMFLMSSLLKSSNQTLQEGAVSLVENISHSGSSQTNMTKHFLPELVKLLNRDGNDEKISDQTITAACTAFRKLMRADNETSKKVVSPELVNTLMDISKNECLENGSKAASLLLYNMWNEKNFPTALKKMGFFKTDFVNEDTIDVHKSSLKPQ